MKSPLLLLAVLSLLLAACGGSQVQPSLAPVSTLATSTAAALPSPSLTYTPTPTATALPPTVTPTVLVPSPLPPSPTPPRVFASDTAVLTLTAEIVYSSWEMVTALAWSADGELLAVAAGENVSIYETQTFSRQVLFQPGDWTNGLAFDPADPARLAAAVRDGNVRIWDISSGQEQCAFKPHPQGATRAVWSAGGQLLVTAGNDPIVHVWDLSTGCPPESLGDIIGGGIAVPDLEINPAGDILANPDGSVVRLRDPVTRRLVTTLLRRGAGLWGGLSPLRQPASQHRAGRYPALVGPLYRRGRPHLGPHLCRAARRPRKPCQPVCLVCGLQPQRRPGGSRPERWTPAALAAVGGPAPWAGRLSQRTAAPWLPWRFRLSCIQPYAWRRAV